jgi:CheY-like chemotaxis protein
MTKIMLVEDDKSLREIYGVRLLAEGYDIVSASDGEEALAMAIKERPALIVTDVMMPRISGFDMLDILRSTTETRNIKVIMMTALSSEDQRKHGEQLGADRYLVKSQVGIEDVVRVVHEVLNDTPSLSAPNPAGTTPPAQTVAPSAPATPVAPQSTPRPMAAAQPRTMPPAPQAPAAPNPAATVHTAPAMPAARTTTPPAPSTRQRIIQPINDPTAKIDINGLLDKELAREAGVDLNNRPTVATTQQERAQVAQQLQAATANPVTPPATPQPTTPAPPVQQTQPTAPVMPPTPPRPPVQAPQRPNIAPAQPGQDSFPPAQ